MTVMRAVVLVGGEGTRLRPLTETVPKPLLPLVDRTILDHVLDHLVVHGVREVIMSSPYLEDTFHPFIQARRGVPAITWITEREALGTGGAIVSALDRLGDHPFLALNGDVLTDLDLTAMVASHRERAAAVTIALHHVEDARAFGLVETDRSGRVTEFREKPVEARPGEINAGTYVLDPPHLRPWAPNTNISIEEEVFPSLIAENAPVHGFRADAYWCDLGTHDRYLGAHFDLLAGKVRDTAYDAPWIGRRAQVDPTVRLGRSVVVGPGAVVGAGVEADRSVFLRGAVVGRDTRILGSIVGPGARAGARVTLIDCVLGEGARVPDGASLEHARVPPGALAAPS